MRIKNVNLFSAEGIFKPGEICTEDDYITKASQDQIEIDGKGMYAIPGLIDTHIHGCKGHDFCEGTNEALDVMCNYLASQGITAFLPTSMSLPGERLEEIFSNYGNYKYKEGAIPVGIHMEGPFFESAKKGAQNGEYLKGADLELFKKLHSQSKEGIKIVSISPVIEEAMSFIGEVKEEAALSLAHTTANYDLATQAFKVGANRVTHLYNAMLPFSHREPGVVGAAFDHKEAYVELISDGIHVHPSVVRSTFELFKDDRIVLVSDNMMAAGMADGSYELGGQEVEVKGNRAILKDGTIAGSVTNLMSCMKAAVGFGVSLESAVRAATINAARSIGVEQEMGSLEEGKLANIVLLNQELEIKAVIIKGKMVVNHL